MCTEDHGDGVPVLDFDRSLLSPLERAAAMARLRADGPERLAHDYEILKELVILLLCLALASFFFSMAWKTRHIKTSVSNTSRAFD
jgi:hypothetical protein